MMPLPCQQSLGSSLFLSKPNISISNHFQCNRGPCSKQTWFPYGLNSPHQIAGSGWGLVKTKTLIKKGPAVKLLSWQQRHRCHFVSSHCSNISRDILDSVFYHSSCNYHVITFLICVIQNINISRTKKDLPKTKRSFFYIW